jgi:hypothetical protein
MPCCFLALNESVGIKELLQAGKVQVLNWVLLAASPRGRSVHLPVFERYLLHSVIRHVPNFKCTIIDTQPSHECANDHITACLLHESEQCLSSTLEGISRGEAQHGVT